MWKSIGTKINFDDGIFKSSCKFLVQITYNRIIKNIFPN